MRNTRNTAKVTQTETTNTTNSDDASSTQVTYTEGPLPEIWIVNGAVGSVDHLELITLPDPKSSEPRQFVLIWRPDQLEEKDGEQSRGICASIGELRTFETGTPASFFVQQDDLLPEEDVQSDDLGEEGQMSVDPPLQPEGCDQDFLEQIWSAGELSALTAEDDCKVTLAKLERLEKEAIRIPTDFEQSLHYIIDEEEADVSRAEADAKHYWAVRQGKRIITSGTYEEKLAERKGEMRRRSSYLKRAKAYCKARRRETCALIDAEKSSEDHTTIVPIADTARAFTTRQMLHMVTSIDVVFLLLPVLCPTPDSRNGNAEDGNRNVFVPFDDIVEAWGQMSRSQAARLVEDQSADGQLTTSSAKIDVSQGIRADIQDAIKRVCDSVDAGGEEAYRFSLTKLGGLLMTKAKRLVEAGLPHSLEEHAMKLIERSELSASTEPDTTAISFDSVGTPGVLSASENETQDSAVSAVFSEEAVSVPTTMQRSPKTGVVESTERLIRFRVAFGYIIANYVPEHVSKALVEGIDEEGRDDETLKALRERIEKNREIEKRVDVSHLYSNKRSADDDERMEERAEKKRKQEEEDKKKKEASFGLKSLAKVNTKGMKKLTSFFQAKSTKEGDRRR